MRLTRILIGRIRYNFRRHFFLASRENLMYRLYSERGFFVCLFGEGEKVAEPHLRRPRGTHCWKVGESIVDIIVKALWIYHYADARADEGCCYVRANARVDTINVPVNYICRAICEMESIFAVDLFSLLLPQISINIFRTNIINN